jgi:hypothetical protein
MFPVAGETAQTVAVKAIESLEQGRADRRHDRKYAGANVLRNPGLAPSQL